MGPAVIALVGVLLQVTLATDCAYEQSAKNLKPGEVDRVISSAMGQLSLAVYNNLSKDRKSSLEEVRFKLASLFNDLQEQCQTLSMDSNDLAGLNIEARKILGTVLESIYGPGSNKGILASINSGALIDRSQPDPLATLLDPVPGSVPGHSADSRKVRRRMHESYSTNRLPCAVCQVKSIQCFYKNGLSSCEACRKSKIRCIKQMPLAQHRQISPRSINTSTETKRDPGKSEESGTLQHRNVVDLTNDAGVAGPTHPGPTSYPRPALNCPSCAKTYKCAWCPESEGYRVLGEICGHQYLTCKLGRPTPNAPPPTNNHRVHQFSPALNGKPETLNRDGAVFGPLVNASSGHHSTGKKRRASASVALQEDQDAVERANNIETSQEHRVRLAREYEELMMGNEGLRAEMGLLKNVRGSG